MGAGSALGGAVVISGIPSNWFEKKRGFATGVVWCAMLPGSFIATNVVARMTTALSWQYAIVVLSVIAFVVVIASSFILKWRPEEVGMYPDGIMPDTLVDASTDKGSVPEQKIIGLTRKQAIRTASFWMLIVAFALCGIAEMGPFQNMPTYLVAQGNDLAFAATFMTFLSFSGIIGKLSAGVIIDKSSPRVAFTIVNALCVIGLLIFFTC